MKTPLSVFTVSYTSTSGGIKEDYVIAVENPGTLDEILAVVEGALRAIGYEHEFQKRTESLAGFESNPEYDLEE